MAKGSIFIVDDEAGIRSTLRQILEDEGYTVEEAESGEEGEEGSEGSDEEVERALREFQLLRQRRPL